MSQPFIGEIIMFAGTFAPSGYALCNGQLMAITQNEALFALIGTTYGGDGVTTFGLPDLRGRAPLHVGQGVGLTNYNLGDRAGSEAVTLTISHLPSHDHTVFCTNFTGTQEAPTNGVWATDASGATGEYDAPTGNNLAVNAIGNAGNSLPHENRQPLLAINFCIALFGVFPSQN